MPHKWKHEDLIAALQGIKADGLSIRAASRTYGIPASTLRDKFHGRSAIIANHGQKKCLTDEEEEKIVEWANKMAHMGLRQSQADIRNVAKMLIDMEGRENPFVDETPGMKWWYSFVKRHPNLIYRNYVHADKARIMFSNQRIETWFQKFEAHLQHESALSMLTEPHRQFEDGRGSALGGVLSDLWHSASSSTSVPSTPPSPQPVPVELWSTPSPEPCSGSPLPDAAQTPLNSTEIPQVGTEVTVLNVEPSTAAPGMSRDQRKKKGPPAAAITVAEFFNYVHARKAREFREEMALQRKKKRKLLKKMKKEADEETDEAEIEEEETSIEAILRESAQDKRNECRIVTPSAERERKKHEEAFSKKLKEKKKKQQKNKGLIIKILDNAHDPAHVMNRQQLKVAKEIAKNIKEERKAMLKRNTGKQKKKPIKKKTTVKKKRGGKKETGTSQKDTIKEAKDKVRTKSNIKSIISDEEIYICPACLKSSGDDEKWISCDHCVRWLHLSCTSMHLVRGIDLAGFDYKCKFC